MSDEGKWGDGDAILFEEPFCLVFVQIHRIFPYTSATISFWSNMFKFLFQTSIGKKIHSLFQKKVDESTLEELEKLFFEADLGSTLANKLTQTARTHLRKNPDLQSDALIELLEKELIA